MLNLLIWLGIKKYYSIWFKKMVKIEPITYIAFVLKGLSFIFFKLNDLSTAPLDEPFNGRERDRFRNLALISVIRG